MLAAYQWLGPAPHPKPDKPIPKPQTPSPPAPPPEPVPPEKPIDEPLRGVGLRAWRGEYWDFARVEGVEVPMSAKVSWELPEGPFTYWEARMQGHRYIH